MATEVRTRNEAEWNRRAGETWDEYFARQDAMVDALQAASDALPDTEVVGALVKFQIADGYAVYRVVRETPLTVEHIPFGDGYRADACTVRGLRKADVLAMVRGDRMFSRFLSVAR